MAGPLNVAEVELQVAAEAGPKANEDIDGGKQPSQRKMSAGSYARLFRCILELVAARYGATGLIRRTVFCGWRVLIMHQAATAGVHGNPPCVGCVPRGPCSTADRMDYLLMAVGTIGGIGSGLMFPVRRGGVGGCLLFFQGVDLAGALIPSLSPGVEGRPGQDHCTRAHVLSIDVRGSQACSCTPAFPPFSLNGRMHACMHALPRSNARACALAASPATIGAAVRHSVRRFLQLVR